MTRLTWEYQTCVCIQHNSCSGSCQKLDARPSPGKHQTATAAAAHPRVTTQQEGFPLNVPAKQALMQRNAQLQEALSCMTSFNQHTTRPTMQDIAHRPFEDPGCFTIPSALPKLGTPLIPSVVHPYLAHLVMYSPNTPHHTNVAIGITTIKEVPVIQIQGKLQRLLRAAGPLKNFLGPVHAHEAVHLTTVNHLLLSSIPQLVVCRRSLKLVTAGTDSVLKLCCSEAS